MSGPSIAAGDRLPELRLGPFTLADAERYAAASLDDNPLHRDADAARAAGLEGPVLHGMLIMGLFPRAIAGWRRDFRVTRLYAAFLRPVAIGRAVTVGGRVVRAVQDGETMKLDLRLVAHTGENLLACVGEASGEIAALEANARSAGSAA